MRRRHIALLALAVAVAVAVALGGWWRHRAGRLIDPDDSVRVERGRVLYAAHCARCHGDRLQGEPDWQIRKPNGELPAPPHDPSGHTWHHGDEYLFAVTKHGMARFAPPDYKTAMPAYVGILTDDDIRAVLGYIVSTWPPDIRARRDAMTRR